MCCIAASYDRKEVERMLRIQAHRAPDGTGIVDVGGFFLGMGRLAILDLTSSGLCPIVDGENVLAFNGELYNYIELRGELEKKGYAFNTTGDSEVLLKAFEEWGIECLQHFNWMGAFAIYRGGKIFIARDVAGEKPLYYKLGNRERNFALASEAKSLDFNCYELPPAYFGVYDLNNNKLSIESWWQLPHRNYSGTYEEALTELDGLLESSVSLRTRADVPYGLYYSGGIDSSLISSYHDFYQKFTYEDKDYKDEFLSIFPKILWHLDYPIKSFTPFGLWKLAEEASKKVKVVLSGEGADELFGGYVRYVPNEFNRKAQKEFPSYKGLFPYKDMLREEFNGNMRELLRMGDRMASAFGIENRCPFLDRRIIEFAFSLPMEWKIDGLTTKKILRDLIKRRIPDYQFEEKKGLYCSVNSWLGETNPFDKETYWNYQQSLYEAQCRNSGLQQKRTDSTTRIGVPEIFKSS